MNSFTNIKEYYSYEGFLDYTEGLIAAGKTSGPDQSELKIQFTKLNFHRMQRWDKTLKLNDELVNKLKSLQPQLWWVITEPWCGDSAQNLPSIAKMAQVSEGNVELRIILRDENLDIMDKYLTNGGRSIPKLVAIGSDEKLFTWGPRPVSVQNLMVDWKANPNGKSFEAFEVELHTWYAKNKGQELQEEFKQLL